MTEPLRVTVPGDSPYDVVIGRGLHGQLAALVPGADRVAVLHSAPLAHRAADIAAASGVPAQLIQVPDGEAGKTVAVAARCWDTLAELGFTRNDVVVGVGGGAVTDLAGWVAGAWLRGVRVVQVPTTMLGMVDAAVGGKTGVNITAGKNLVGAFHPPAGVLADLDALDTLPAPDLLAGLAEVVKAGFIADPVILDLLEADPRAAVDPRRPLLAELVHRAVVVKADVVGGDLKEAGRREILNYGHTLAHAIETVQDFGWRHGDAVSVGLVYAAELGRLAGRCDATLAARHRTVLELLGLPCRYDGPWKPVHAAMALDKKARGARLRFVVLDALAVPSILDDPDPELLRAAYDAVSPSAEAPT